MEDVLKQVAVLAPIFLLSPTVYAAILVVLSSGIRPVSRGTNILIGSAIAVIAIGAILVAGGGTVITRPEQPSTLSGIIDLILGVLLILVALFAIFRKSGKQEETKSAPSSEPNFRKDVRLGIILTVTNPTSLASYITVAKVSADAALDTVQQIIVMGIAGILFVMPIVWPLLLTIAAPKSSEKFLSATNRVLNKYGKYFVAVLLVYFGVNLLTKGLNILK